mmetsp:Transcript_12364/g.28094  ORF Transcript_12364/g.28094 Transcript_12364/m.28094 type:complete len:244 (+) Transcript_12364:413-1144(+)
MLFLEVGALVHPVLLGTAAGREVEAVAGEGVAGDPIELGPAHHLSAHGAHLVRQELSRHIIPRQEDHEGGLRRHHPDDLLPNAHTHVAMPQHVQGPSAAALFAGASGVPLDLPDRLLGLAPLPFAADLREHLWHPLAVALRNGLRLRAHCLLHHLHQEARTRPLELEEDEAERLAFSGSTRRTGTQCVSVPTAVEPRASRIQRVQPMQFNRAGREPQKGQDARKHHHAGRTMPLRYMGFGLRR